MKFYYMSYIRNEEGAIAISMTRDPPSESYDSQLLFIIQQYQGEIRWLGGMCAKFGVQMPLENCCIVAREIEDDQLRMYTLAKLRRLKEIIKPLSDL